MLEEALAAPGSHYRSQGELRQQIEAWKETDRANFDADRYYDSWRAAGYTEHNRGSQETLARRALQLCSIPTGEPPVDHTKECLLAVDLGCGSGLSTAVAGGVRAATLGTIGIDLSSEMLRSPEWEEVSSQPSPLSGERLRCDLSQPLPFRAGVFDLCFSVSAVHYLAQASATRTAEERIGALTRSLRGVLAPSSKPCALQAYLTRDSNALQLFRDVALKDGWNLCDLVVDQSHGRPAERDFLYLVRSLSETTRKPPRCALYAHAHASCALAMEAWAKTSGLPPVCLDGGHRAWLVREHDRFAKRLVRLRKRCQTDGAQLDHAQPLDAQSQLLAEKLEGAIAECENVDEEARLSTVLGLLHA
ncbi:unnamed protein product [Symbiodinium natans]|uniref:Methyltransferase type 11 domain-containing protein n=1 Tax=Symbiodinium natans TaxID=878477 RepID=A0A812KRI4_9DINO|nr:unnamed protein product [Symbiodinium natans]